MKLAINQIKVKKNRRLRRELGDLESLQTSIQELGLLNPIVVDEHYTLVAGYRRLSACAKLGLQEVDVRVVVFDDDQLKTLDAEMAENYYRKDFTPEEIRDGELRRHQILESMRKKSWWEKLMLWFKGLFGVTKQEVETETTTTIHEDLGIAESQKADTPIAAQVDAPAAAATEQADVKTAQASPSADMQSPVVQTKTGDKSAPEQPVEKPEKIEETPTPADGEQETATGSEEEDSTPVEQKKDEPAQDPVATELPKDSASSRSAAADVKQIFPDPRASK